MSFVHENGVGVVASVIPWTYLAGGAAAATALVLLSKKLYGCPTSTHQNGVPLPPGPPATWFWGNPMPKQKYVCCRTYLHRARQGLGQAPSPRATEPRLFSLSQYTTRARRVGRPVRTCRLSATRQPRDHHHWSYGRTSDYSNASRRSFQITHVTFLYRQRPKSWKRKVELSSIALT